MRKSRDLAATAQELERGERFLAAYNVIEQAMQRKTGDPSSKESFRRLVDQLSDRDWTVRKFRDDLTEFAELRNAIVHERISPRYLIAVPLDGTVDRIERIAESMQRPPQVYPRFRREVVQFSPLDTMKTVFAAMNSTGYSQFPVYRGTEYIGLLTDGGIARWISGALGGGPQREDCDPLQVAVGEVLKSEKTSDRARFIGRGATIWEAEELFASPGAAGYRWRVAALLITETGSAEEKLLGIITPYDILTLTLE